MQYAANATSTTSAMMKTDACHVELLSVCSPAAGQGNKSGSAPAPALNHAPCEARRVVSFVCFQADPLIRSTSD